MPVQGVVVKSANFVEDFGPIFKEFEMKQLYIVVNLKSIPPVLINYILAPKTDMLSLQNTYFFGNLL